MGMPAKPAAESYDVHLTMIRRKKNVSTNSVTKHEVRLYLPGLRSP